MPETGNSHARSSRLTGLPLWSKIMFLHLIDAKHVEDHRVHVWFNDGTDGEVDLSGSLDGPVFAPLRDVEYFRSFEIVGHTLAWPNGADFAPEYLHAMANAPTHA